MVFITYCNRKGASQKGSQDTLYPIWLHHSFIPYDTVTLTKSTMCTKMTLGHSGKSNLSTQTSKSGSVCVSVTDPCSRNNDAEFNLKSMLLQHSFKSEQGLNLSFDVLLLCLVKSLANIS